MKKLMILLVLVLSLVVAASSVFAAMCGDRSQVDNCNESKGVQAICEAICLKGDPGNMCQYNPFDGSCTTGPGCGEDPCYTCSQAGGECLSVGECGTRGGSALPKNYECPEVGFVCCVGAEEAPEFNTFGIIAGIIVIGAAVFWYVKKKKK